MLLFLSQLPLGLRQLAVFQPGGLFQVVVLLGALDLSVQLFNLLPQLLDAADGVFLGLPSWPSWN